jgi:hypothetical protein
MKCFHWTFFTSEIRSESTGAALRSTGKESGLEIDNIVAEGCRGIRGHAFVAL